MTNPSFRSLASSVFRHVIRDGAVALVVLAATGERVLASPASRALTSRGYALAYDLQFDAAYLTFAEAADLDTSDPAPHRAEAALAWMEMLFAQGVGTFEAFAGEITKSDVPRPTVPAALRNRFHAAITKATMRASRPPVGVDQADMFYQLGATATLNALYTATVEGRTLGAFGEARRGVNAMERARELEPGRKETGLILGLSQYTISTMAWPVRTLAKVSGLSSNRKDGLALLEEAATPGTETEADASLLLMLIDVRERHADQAVRRLTRLHEAHPGNRILSMNLAVADLMENRPADAEPLLTEGLAAFTTNPRPFLLGEGGMWFANRGAARLRLNRPDDARADLQSGLQSAPREWVRGRIHALLAEIAAAQGDRELARRELLQAIEMSSRGGDEVALASARQRLKALGPPAATTGGKSRTKN